MAGHGDTNESAASHFGDMDVTKHRAAYEGFLGWFKWGAIASFAIAFIVVVIIAS